MERILKITHKGKNVIIFDFSGMGPGKEALDLYLASIAECKKHPLDSILSITDVTDARYDYETLEGMKKFSNLTKAHTKRSAVVGVTGMKKVGYQIVMMFSKRNLPIFDTRAEALDWLVK